MANVRFGSGFEFDAAAGQLRKRGTKLRLRDQPVQVLAMLLEHPGEVVTREQLLRRLWPHDVVIDFDNNLNTAVGRLRAALGDSAEHPRFIETLPRRGYRFLPKVIEVVQPRTRARLLVLPFVNSSGDPSQEYFSDAMTDEIIAELAARAPAQLAVLAGTTSKHYKGTHKGIERIAGELSLDYVVEGSCRRTDKAVALTVQLIRATDQTHMFAGRYEMALAELFDLQRTAAHAIGERIDALHPAQRHLAGPGAPPPRNKAPRDLLAYNSYIQGRYHLDRGESPESWKRARECLEHAIARDPLFAAAYDALAELWWLAGFAGLMPPRETLPIGIAHALRALDIDNTLAEAHAMLAQYRKQVAYDWNEVNREMEIALELDPDSPIVRMRRAVTGLMPHGRIDEAVADLERALDRDPLAMWLNTWLVTMLWLGRRYGAAVERAQLLLKLTPAHFVAHFVAGIVFREARMFDDATSAHRRASELSGGTPLTVGWLGLALAESGDAAGARRLLEHLRAVTSHAYVPPTSIAWIHLGLGEIADFFEWMNRAIDARDHMLMPIKTYPFLDRIRDDPRYTDLLRRMNLA